MPTIQVADKPTLDWIKNKFYKTNYTATASNDVVATLIGESVSKSTSGGSYENGIHFENKYTVLYDGTYRMSVKFAFSEGDASHKLHLGVFKNGVLVTEFCSEGTTDDVIETIDVSAKKDDIFDIRAYTETPGSRTFIIRLITVGATYLPEQVEMDLEDFENEEYNNTMGGRLGKESSPTTIKGKGVINFVGASSSTHFTVDGGTEISLLIPNGAILTIHFNKTITAYSPDAYYVAQTI